MTVPWSQRVFRLLSLFEYYLGGEVVSNYAAKPASEDLAAVLFPPVMHKRSLKGQWELVCGNRL